MKESNIPRRWVMQAVEGTSRSGRGKIRAGLNASSSFK